MNLIRLLVLTFAAIVRVLFCLSFSIFALRFIFNSAERKELVDAFMKFAESEGERIGARISDYRLRRSV